MNPFQLIHLRGCYAGLAILDGVEDVDNEVEDVDDGEDDADERIKLELRKFGCAASVMIRTGHVRAL
jgi:hypothetical protein